MKDLFPEAKKSVFKAIYAYQNGTRKIRKADKSFYWQHSDGRGGWNKGRGNAQHCLYEAGEIADTVYICEGEKDADSVHELGFNAVSGENGAGPGKWCEEYTKQLERCKTAYIFCDNDDVGRAYQQEIAAKLSKAGIEVYILDLTEIWPEIPEHGDISDYIAHVGKDEALKVLSALITAAPKWESAVVSEPAATVPERGMALTVQIMEQSLSCCGINLRYDMALNRVEISGLPSCYSQENAANVLPVIMQDFLKNNGIKNVTRQRIDDCLAVIADKHRFNPIQDYLKAGSWDGIDRLTVIYDILNIIDPRYQMYIRKWFIQCVALAFNESENPVSSEGVLVLQGAQGCGKTSFFRIITPNPRWFVEGASLDMNNKDSLITALSGWICELGELDSTLKREQSSLKAFVTRPEDRIRVPYARLDTRAPRRTSFCGTVNQADYLKDETGSRRFWTVPVENVDKKRLFAIDSDFVHQLWLQVYQLYKENPLGFRMTDKEMTTLQDFNRDFEIPLKYEIEIREMLDYTLPMNDWEWWSTGEIARRLYCPADSSVPIGKALRKILTSPPLVSAGLITSPKNPDKRHGVMSYMLPLRHYTSGWGGRGVSGRCDGEEAATGNETFLEVQDDLFDCFK